MTRLYPCSYPRTAILLTAVLSCAAHAAPLVQHAQYSRVTEPQIRERLRAYEAAWNDGDLNAVIDEYAVAMSGIVGGEFLDGPRYLNLVRELYAAADRPHLRLEINAIRLLGKSYAIVNGQVHTVPKAGAEEISPFTLIYECTDGQCKLTYSHS